ncbi:MAG TPA: hypothetical protein P5098_00505, partial [Candidatus Dojkabacteria bacterium]|nr:hypothetical protein [Candidatus Dojkabacteria bacterium]
MPVNGMDSYFFINYIYGITDSIPETPILSQTAMDLIPPNLFVIKTIMLIIVILSVLIFAWASENIKPGYAVLLAMLLLGNIFFNKLLIRFEDDLFALPFIALSFYLITLYLYKKRDLKWLYLALGSWVVSCLFWKFAVYLIILYALWTMSYIFFTPAMILVLFSFDKLFSGAIGNFVVKENMPFIGILVLFLPFIVLLFWKKTNPYYEQIIVPLWFSLVMILINVKMALLFFPFMAIYFFVTLKKQPKELKIINVLVILLIFGIATYQNLNAVPNWRYYELIDIAQQQKETSHKEINVSWGFGYFWIWNS